MSSYLGEREAQLLCQPDTFFPLTTTNSLAVLVDPASRTAHDLADPPDLVNLVSTGEEGLERRNLNSHRTNGPDVDGCRVLTGS